MMGDGGADERTEPGEGRVTSLGVYEGTGIRRGFSTLEEPTWVRNM